MRASAEARRRLVALRDDGTIGDAAFQRVEEELDCTELGWEQTLRAVALQELLRGEMGLE